jgi:hypothetical protein
MNQSIQGKVGEETMDCVLPHERKIKCIEFKGETTKFVYEREMVSTEKIIQKTRTGPMRKTVSISLNHLRNCKGNHAQNGKNLPPTK